MKVIVHVGSPKTGTSSLQQFLYANRENLKARGVVYPDFGFRAHTILSAAFFGGVSAGERLTKRVEGKKNLMQVEGFKEHLHELLTKFDQEVLILSNEGLSRKPRAGNLVPFVAAARPDAEIIVLDYIREPVAHFPSATQQYLKLDGDHTLYPATWQSTHCVRGDYLLDTIKDHELVFRIFSPETLVNGDAIDDFNAFVSRRTGIEMPANEEQVARNISFSAPACGMLALVDLVTDQPFPEGRRGVFSQQLRKADEALKPEKLKLPDDFRQAIIANNHEAWNRLVAVSDHDEATRARVELPTATLPAGIEEANTATWAAKSLNKPYVLAFMRAMRANAKMRDSKQIIPWVTHAVSATEALHGVKIERSDIAELKQSVELESGRVRKSGRRRASYDEPDAVALEPGDESED